MRKAVFTVALAASLVLTMPVAAHATDVAGTPGTCPAEPLDEFGQPYSELTLATTAYKTTRRYDANDNGWVCVANEERRNGRVRHVYFDDTL